MMRCIDGMAGVQRRGVYQVENADIKPFTDVVVLPKGWGPAITRDKKPFINHPEEIYPRRCYKRPPQ